MLIILIIEILKNKSKICMLQIIFLLPKIVYGLLFDLYIVRYFPKCNYL